MNNNRRFDATTNGFGEDEFSIPEERNIQVLNRKFDIAPSTSRETRGGKFGKPYIADDVFRIIRPALENIRTIRNETVQNQAVEIITNIVDLTAFLPSQGIDIERVPPLHAVALDDGSFLVEWIFAKYRIGFVLDENENESLWYLVSAIEEANIEKSGLLIKLDKKSLLLDLITFVFNYS